MAFNWELLNAYTKLTNCNVPNANRQTRTTTFRTVKSLKHRQNQKSHRKRKQQEINKAYKPNSVPNAFLLNKASSEKSPRQPPDATSQSGRRIIITC